MRETPAPGRSEDHWLLRQALGYARGELAAAEAHAFEQGLAHDQATRDALCQAVCLAGASAPLPDPAFRAAVRRRLRAGGWRRLLGRRPYRGHPLLWTGLGAAAAALLTLGVLALARPGAGPTAPPVVAEAEAPAEEASPEPPRPSSVEMARVWAELHNSAHLARAHEEEVRRKHRAEGRSVKAEERRARPLHHVRPRHQCMGRPR
jgi:hypothetical protein